jgi:hypothetical protein
MRIYEMLDAAFLGFRGMGLLANGEVSVSS